MKYRHGRKLVGDRTAKSCLDQVKITETQFADDPALYATSRDAFESATRKFIETTSMCEHPEDQGNGNQQSHSSCGSTASQHRGWASRYGK